MEKNPVVILEDSAFFRKGQIIEKYENDEEGILCEDKYIHEGSYVVLNEKLSPEEEAKVKDIVRQQFKTFFWNMYTKQSLLLGS